MRRAATNAPTALGGARRLTHPIVKVMPKLIRQAAIVGFDEAGKLLLPGIWPILKKILQPVVEELERRYPRSFLLNGSEDADPGQVQAAIDTLSNDEALQQMLISGFAGLKEGQEEILTQITNVQGQLDTIESGVGDLSTLVSEIQTSLRSQGGEGLEALDVEQIIEEFLGAKAPELLEKLKNDPTTYQFVVHAIKLGMFFFDVLDNGVDRRTYKFEGVDGVHLYTPKPRKKDESGREYRQIEHTILHEGESTTVTETAILDENGRWITV